jgi:hypothetical protein
MQISVSKSGTKKSVIESLRADLEEAKDEPVTADLKASLVEHLSTVTDCPDDASVSISVTGSVSYQKELPATA